MDYVIEELEYWLNCQNDNKTSRTWKEVELAQVSVEFANKRLTEALEAHIKNASIKAQLQRALGVLRAAE